MRTTVQLLAAALLVAAGLVQAQQPARPGVDVFFDNPAFTAGRLSPSGRYLALGVTRKGGRTQLAVLDTDKLTAKVIASPSDADVARIEWVNDNRLVFNLEDRATGQGDQLLGPGLYAVDRDGGDFRQLVDRVQQTVRERGDVRTLNYFTYLHGPTRTRDSDDVFVTQWQANNLGEFDTANLLRLDTRTGRTSTYARPGKTVRWLVDMSNTPRAAVTFERDTQALHYLQPDGQWRKLAEHTLQQGNREMRLVDFAADGSLYVAARNGRDTLGLYRFDLQKNALDGEPIVQAAGFDFEGVLVHGKAGVLGIGYLTDARTVAWFDPAMKAAQAKVDALLPRTVNLLQPPLRGEVPLVLVRSFSDVDPGSYALFNTETGKLTPIGAVMRDADPRQMAQRDFVKIQARDGLTVPAWLTVPRGGKGRKHPLVVLVHGGPWVRGGEWYWEPESQFLASRGYAVIEPEFRGSAGWGFEHFRKSFKQWGLAMQNDVADAARWAIAQGIAEPGRICIAGEATAATRR